MRTTIGLGALVAVLAACGSSVNGANGAGSGGSTGTGGSGGSGGSAPSECFDPKPGCIVASSKMRDTKPAVADGDREALRKGNESFALDVERKLPAGNLVLSPFSISTALAMTYAGARGTTEQAIAKALHFDLPQAKLHPAFDDLLLQLDSRRKGSDSFKGGGFRLHTANAIWSQVGLKLDQGFSDLLYTDYGAPVRLADFVQSKQAETLINGWVSSQTEGLIPELLSGNVTPETQLVLVNAIYFDAAWATPFDKANTQPGAFKPTADTSVMASMMHGTIDTRYASSSAWEAVELPYAGVPISMFLIMPKTGTADAYLASLDGAGLDGVVAAMTGKRVDVTMPQFQFGSRASLKKALSDLGMGEAFGLNADLSGITGKPNGFQIQDVIHQAVIDVAEAGTKAAAATAVLIATSGATGITPDPAKIVLDHPYYFFITDLPTGAILFSGRVADPTKH